MTFIDVMKAAFDFVFGLQLETLLPPEDERRDVGASDSTPAPRYLDEELGALALPQPYFSLTGQVPTRIISVWR
ncbi:hypothetical protein C2E23DRAFT_882738 [Lenzites betulinus]|nr:hypothetical protein C2E23DRAFT_882738 [Lenzites betulinus]